MGYRAFFSYARADDKIANWLHRQLDGYRTPKALVGAEGALGPVPTKLHPIFRDRTDLQAGGHIDQSLQQALEESETLVVLCTPTSAKSRWVNHECETFLKIGHIDRISPVIAAGEPDSGDPETECFPPALRGKGLLAADLREIKKPSGHLIGDGREGGRIKLVAGLLGVPLDRLVQRERRRQRGLVAALTAAAVVFAMVAAVAVLQTFAERAARELAASNERRARETLALMLSERSWQAADRGEDGLAVRYALAGLRAAPVHATAFRAALARIEQGASGEARVLVADPRRGWIRAMRPDAARVRVVTASDNGVAAIHNLVGARGAIVLGQPANMDRLSSAEFSPSGARVITGSYDGMVRIWDGATGRLTRTLDVGGPVSDARYGPDGRVIAAGAPRAGLAIFDAESGALLRRINHPNLIPLRLFFAPQGHLLLAINADGTAQLWAPTEGRLHASISASPFALSDAAFNRAGDRMAFASREGVTIWRVETGRLVRRLPHAAYVNRVQFSPDGALIASADIDGAVRVWSADTGALIWSAQAHNGQIKALVFSDDGLLLATGSDDRTARLWGVRDGAPVTAMRGHDSSVGHISFLDAGRTLVTASDDATVRLWPIRPNHVAMDLGEKIWVARPNFDGSLTTFVYGSKIKDDISTGEGELRRPDGALVHGLGAVNLRGLSALSLSRDGALIALAYTGGSRVEILSPTTGQLLAEIVGHADEVRAIAFDGDRRILTSSHELAAIWDARTGARVAILAHSNQDVNDVCFSPDGRSAVLAGVDGVGRVFDVETGALRFELRGHEGEIQALAVSRNGAVIATGSADGTARVWRASDGVALGTMRGHESDVLAFAISADGSRLATASLDTTARVWDVATGRELTRFQTVSQEDLPVGLFFADGGNSLMLAKYSGVVDRFNIPALNASLDELVRRACVSVLAPTREARSFSSSEIAADPLIAEVWLRGHGAARDVCEGVPVPSILELVRVAGPSATPPPVHR